MSGYFIVKIKGTAKECVSSYYMKKLLSSRIAWTKDPPSILPLQKELSQG